MTKNKTFATCSTIPTRRPGKNLYLMVLMLFLSGFFLTAMPSLLQAAQVTLAWDANNPTPDGYRLYQRLENQNYDYARPAWQGSATTCTLNDLQDGARYYFVVRAFSGSQDSGDSNEVNFETTATNPNQAPTANAGGNQTAVSQSRVFLDGSGSSDPENQSLTYSWTQSSGRAVTLANPGSAHPAFTAPLVNQNTTLAFELTVRDPLGLSSSDTCLVMIEPQSVVNDDRDGDGHPDDADAFPDDPSEWLDTDGDGIGNNADTDDDNDQMPDAWETQHGLNPLVDEAAQDLDGDGISNLDEYNQGTDPAKAEGNRAPLAPNIIYPGDGESRVSVRARFTAGPFEDPDAGDSHAGTQWRIFTADQDKPVFNRTVRWGNLTTLRMPWLILRPATTYYCEARYYDDHGNASPWSGAVTFTTAASRWDKNSNGIPDGQETGASGDLNKDGVADIDQEPLVKSATIGDGLLLGVSIMDCTHAVSIETIEIEPASAFEDSPYTAEEIPYGLLGFAITVDQPGQEANISMYSSQAMSQETVQWVRFDEIDGWQTCEDRVTTNSVDGSVQYQIRDGGEGDADGVANGVIVDLSGPLMADAQVDDGTGLGEGSDTSSGGSSGAGCFVNSLLFKP